MPPTPSVPATPPRHAAPPSIWVIGDLQGCLGPCTALLDKIDQLEGHAQARLWFAGDLVNRGPSSLATLRAIRALGTRAETVLGNHDLHLLAVSLGIRPLHRNDTLQEILDAPDREALLDWLRRRPLAHFEQGHLLVHAGVLPQWSAATTLALANEVEHALRGPGWGEFLRHMYGNEPAQWQDDLHGVARLRCIVNGLTRLRFCTIDGVMDFHTKEGSGSAPAGFYPWFEVAGRQSEQSTVVFGHWSTLGLIVRENLISLDTGCVWGGKLSAVRLSDRTLLQVDCPQAQAPGKG